MAGEMDEWLLDTVRLLITALEVTGIVVIIGGFMVATVAYVARPRQWAAYQAYVDYRRHSVRGLILGLEFLIAADIIKTVAMDYTMRSMLMLGFIILIRAFLVFALHLEIDGRLPWTRSERDTPP